MTNALEAAPLSREGIGRRRTGRAVFSSLAGVAQRLLQVASTLIVMPLVLHAVGRESFGIWAAAASLLWMMVVVDFGVGQALLGRIAGNLARADAAEARREIGAAAFVSIGLAVLGVALALALIPGLASPASRESYLIAALCMAINIPLNLAGNIWSGLQRFHMTAAWEAFQTLFTLLTLFVLTRLTSDVRWYVLVTAGGLLLANCFSAASLFLRHPELRPDWSAPSFARCRSLLRGGAPFLVLSIAATLSINLDSVIALSLLGPDAAAQMAVAQRACITAYGLLWVVTQPLWPAFADATTRGDHAWVRRHIFGALAVVAAGALAGAAILVAFGQKLIEIWMGGEMQIGAEILWAMAAWIVALCLGRVVDVLLNGVGAVWFQARVAIAFATLAFLLKLVLGPMYGVAGVLAATALAYGLTAAPAYLWWSARWLRKTGAARAEA